MTSHPDWLPPLLCLEAYGGNWKEYIEAIYAHFKNDFIDSKPKFGRKNIGLKRHPLLDGKEATFWHITSEGRVEDKRLPDLRRCERIRWPRPMIERCGDPALRCWPNKRGKDNRIVLWLADQDYVVVLADRKSYVLLWTAFYVTYENKRRELAAEYEDFIKRLTPPAGDGVVAPSTHGR